MRRAFTAVSLLAALIFLPGCHYLYGIGSVSSGGESAVESAAQSDVRASIPAIEAYYADHSTYEGLSFAVLVRDYDRGLQPVRIASASASSYCVESAVDGVFYSKAGPAADIVPGPCPDSVEVPQPELPEPAEVLRVAVPLMEARHAQHGTFAGVSPEELVSFVGREVRIVVATTDRYCIELDHEGVVWSARESGDVGVGAC